MPLHNELDKPFEGNGTFAWTVGANDAGLTVRHFRLTFELARKPQSLPVHVTADSRYRLYVNGKAIGRGPLKGTIRHYHIETYDLAEMLKKGPNTLAAEVRWFGENAPTSEVHSAQPGFMVSSPLDRSLNTPGNWKARIDTSVNPDMTPYHDNAHLFLNHMENVDLRLRDDKDWKATNYDDSDWEKAVPIGLPVNKFSNWGVSDLHSLYHHNQPQLTEEPKRFAALLRDHAYCENHFGPKPRTLKVSATQTETFILDAGGMATGYPSIRLRGGRGREVRITYAESMGFWESSNGTRSWVKRRRDDINGEANGYRDTITLSGRDEVYEPFHWRTFWFVKIEVLAGDEPCEIVDIDYKSCIFPMKLSAHFESSDPDVEALWTTSWRTAQLCAHETYEDCPYYEQLNYTADTRLQSLVSYYLANETRLARRSIRLYRDSARPDGLIESRVPSTSHQIIPYFSFHWIFMVDDYWNWVGEKEAGFVKSCLHAVDGILVFFRNRLTKRGFVGKVPRWNMVDYAEGWIRGEPHAIAEGESTYLTCLFIKALDTAIRLHTEVGRSEDAIRWTSIIQGLREKVRSLGWDESLGLFLEAPNRPELPISEHTQCAAILASVPSDRQLSSLAESLESRKDLIQPTFMQSYYTARALEDVDSYGLFHDRILNDWRMMIRQGASTWWEYPESPRSDCHAWSSWISVDFLSTILGAKPALPGWRKIRLQPKIDGLEWARGTFKCPVGTIAAHWRKDHDQLLFEAETPYGIPVELHLPGRPTTVFEQGGKIRESIRLTPETGYKSVHTATS